MTAIAVPLMFERLNAEWDLSDLLVRVSLPALSPGTVCPLWILLAVTFISGLSLFIHY